MRILPHHKLIASYEANVFGIARPPISVFRDELGASAVCIVEARDRPIPRCTSYATVGLSDCEIRVGGKILDYGVELVGAFDSDYQKFGNLMATAAFMIINSGWSCAPGMIFPDVATLHDENFVLCDLYFTHPFTWPERMDKLNIGSRHIAFLQVLPIAKSETELARRLGPRELESRLERSGLNVFDLKRPHVS